MRVRGILQAAAVIMTAAALLGTVFWGGTVKAQEMAQETAQERMATQGTAVRGGGIEAAVPTSIQPRPSVSDTWRAVRRGEAGFVTIPDAQAGVLIQSQGEEWRQIRNSLLKPATAWGMLGMVGLLTLFYLLRGRIRIEGGPSGKLILRFTSLERFAHWLTAVSFILLALTGLILLFGRHVLIPVMGRDAFSVLAQASKYLHNFGGFFFIAGLLLILVLWVRENLWDRYDLNWILKGGGLVGKAHPPAAKFNFGQKVVFWMVILVGTVISVTGVTLLFPFQWMDMDGMQTMAVIHIAAAALMICAILAHIYIGTIGMEGAADAMTSGYVDTRWAEHHHAAWVEKVRAEGSAVEKPAQTPSSAGHKAEQPAE